MVIVVWEESIRTALSRLGSEGFAAGGCSVVAVAVAVAADGDEDEDEDDRSDSETIGDFTGPWPEDGAMDDEDGMGLLWR